MDFLCYNFRPLGTAIESFLSLVEYSAYCIWFELDFMDLLYYNFRPLGTVLQQQKVFYHQCNEVPLEFGLNKPLWTFFATISGHQVQQQKVFYHQWNTVPIAFGLNQTLWTYFTTISGHQVQCCSNRKFSITSAMKCLLNLV